MGKKTRTIFFTWLFFLLVNLSFAQDKPVITVMDFSVEDISENEMKAIISRLSSAMFQTNVYTVIDISQREMLLEELKFSLSGCVDDSCALEAGKLLSAENIVVGNISLIGNRYSLSAKTLETETGKTIYSADGLYNDLESLIDDVNNIALQLSGLSENDILQAKNKADPRKIAAWSTLGGGAALAAAGTFFFISGYSMLSDAETAYDEYMSLDGTATAIEINAAWDNYMAVYNKAIDNNANAQLIGGLVCLGAGIVSTGVSVFLFMANPDSEKDSVALSVINNNGNPGLLLNFRL